MDKKKIGVLILMLVVVIGVGWAIYSLFFAPVIGPAPIPTPEAPTPVAPLPIAPTGAPPRPAVPVTPLPEVPTAPTPSPVAAGGLTQVTPIANMPTVGADVATDGTLNFYSRTDGKFYRLNDDGTTSLLSNKTFYNVDQATFNPQGTSAILEYPDGANIFYDFGTGKQVTLPKHWEEFRFTADGSRIAAKSLGLDRSNRSLVVANPDGSNARAIQELGENADKVIVAWSPTDQVVAFAKTGPYGGDFNQEIYLIGQNDENFRSLSVHGLNFQPKWAPSGEKLLYSVATPESDYKPQLWIVDAAGDAIGNNRRSLPVNTWADKCVFSGDDAVYCAVPTSLEQGYGLQPTLTDGTPDDIIRVDLKTGLQEAVAVPEGEHTISRLILSPDGGKLYFTDKNSGTIGSIRLK